MSGRAVALPRGRTVEVAEAGEGPTVVYLHGIADIHGASFGWLPFHEALAEKFALIAPAHPGCAESSEDEALETVDDLVFHYLELFDALGLETLRLAGSCIGGWIAAEIAVRHPERIERLALIGPTGLFVPGAPIADVFWETHPADGVSFAGLRALLFGDGESDLAREMFPDLRGDIDREVLRYKLFRFASRIGFSPPYLHDRRLAGRLARYRNPVLAIQGADDRLVPRRHGEVYAEGFGDARLEVVEEAGHSAFAERPDAVAALVADFLAAP